MKCEECKYIEISDEDHSECRRGAPRIVEAMVAPNNMKESQRYVDMLVNEFEAYTIWPQVNLYDWCGEFEAKKERVGHVLKPHE